MLERIDAAFRAAPPVPCRSGCSACCHGPFDISPADAVTIADGMTTLDDHARELLVSRARDEIAAFQQVHPDWQAPFAIASLGDAEFDAIAELRATAPCPALGSLGTCAVYRHRPSTCRLMGRGWDAGDGDVLANACPIQAEFPGYAGMPAAPIDLDGIESDLEAIDLEAADGGWVSTTVAGAVLTWASRQGATPAP